MVVHKVTGIFEKGQALGAEFARGERRGRARLRPLHQPRSPKLEVNPILSSVSNQEKASKYIIKQAAVKRILTQVSICGVSFSAKVPGPESYADS